MTSIANVKEWIFFRNCYRQFPILKLLSQLHSSVFVTLDRLIIFFLKKKKSIKQDFNFKLRKSPVADLGWNEDIMEALHFIETLALPSYNLSFGCFVSWHLITLIYGLWLIGFMVRTNLVWRFFTSCQWRRAKNCFSTQTFSFCIFFSVVSYHGRILASVQLVCFTR